MGKYGRSFLYHFNEIEKKKVKNLYLRVFLSFW